MARTTYMVVPLKVIACIEKVAAKRVTYPTTAFIGDKSSDASAIETYQLRLPPFLLDNDKLL